MIHKILYITALSCTQIHTQRREGGEERERGREREEEREEERKRETERLFVEG